MNSKAFEKVYIEISNVCNLQCSFCPEVERSKKLMSLDFFKKLLPEVAELTDQVTFHLMGDPLLHPDFFDFVKLCEQNKLSIHLVTNGTLLTEKKVEWLLHPSFRQVNFSLHSFFDNFPHRDPAKYLSTVFSFVDQALERRPDLYLNFRLWNLFDQRGKSVRNQEMLQAIEQRFDWIKPQSVEPRRKKSFKIKGRLYLHFDTEFVWPALDLPILSQKGRCYGLSSHFGIHADGTVVPCCLDKEAGIPLGHWPTQSLQDILSAPRSIALLDGFQQGKLVEPLCQRCDYATRFQNNKKILSPQVSPLG